MSQGAMPESQDQAAVTLAPKGAAARVLALAGGGRLSAMEARGVGAQ
jgi:hypothetical protein